jgi:hypothetical protein
VIDYDEVYRALATRGAALPQQVFWNEVASELKSGGACAGIQLLERQLRELHANLCNYLRAVEAMSQLPIGELGHSLHDTSLEVSILVMGFTRFLTTCTYISTLCERAMLLHEQELTQTVVGARCRVARNSVAAFSIYFAVGAWSTRLDLGGSRAVSPHFPDCLDGVWRVKGRLRRPLRGFALDSASPRLRRLGMG